MPVSSFSKTIGGGFNEAGIEDERINSYEVHLDISQWNDLDAKYKNWSEYNGNSEHMWQREELVKRIVKLITAEVLPKLTARQRQIIKWHFEDGLNEEKIADMLGISQPTVSQHLFGKKRNGKKIGGSISKMRKIFRKKYCYRGEPEQTAMLQEFFDTKMWLNVFAVRRNGTV